MTAADPPIVADGHTHIFNRVYWEHIDPWQPQPFGFDFARAFASGVNVIIENLGPYGYANFGQGPEADPAPGSRPPSATSSSTHDRRPWP